MVVITGVNSQLELIDQNLLLKTAQASKSRNIPVFLDDAYGTGFRPIIFGQPKTMQTRVELDITTSDLVVFAEGGIGLALPPIGLWLILICGINRASLSEVTKPLLPYIEVLFLSLVVIMFDPWSTLIIQTVPFLLVKKVAPRDLSPPTRRGFTASRRTGNFLNPIVNHHSSPFTERGFLAVLIKVKGSNGRSRSYLNSC